MGDFAMKKVRQMTRREFISTATVAAGAAFLPAAGDSAGVQDATTPAGRQDQITWRARPFSPRQVRLGEGPFRQAMEANQKYLHFLPADRLLHNFRVTAGRPSTAEPVGGWEKPDGELRGHFAGGHILTAFALAYASSGDETLKTKGNYMVSELAKVQEALGGKYLGAYPTELYDRLRDRREVWAPFYTYHKIMAGHLDMYLHCGNGQALEVAENMARWAGEWTKPLSAEHMQRVLEVEHGGMLDVLSELCAVTGKQEYLDTANRFDHKKVFNPLAAGRDELKGLHANTNIPKITGVARRYELTGARRDHDIASYFWREITSRRMYANGGTSCDEHWRTDPGKLASELTRGTCECCCAYNMMKLTRHLYGWTADPRYFDYYERTLFNHRLGTINPEDGSTMYYVPVASGFWKFFNSPLDSFWCCTGTGVEEYARLADSIYWHDANALFVNLFMASELHWPEKGIHLKQETRFPEEETSSLTLQCEKPVILALNIRVPYWAVKGVTIKVNGRPQAVAARPSSYIALRRKWMNGDKVEVTLPMSLHVHAMPDDPTLQAMMYGPLLLVGRLGAQGLTKEMMYGGSGPVPAGEAVPAPTIVGDARNPVAWLERTAGESLTFRALGQSQPITLVPFYKLWGERYATYWKVRT
jgi:DUF1680 family protein